MSHKVKSLPYKLLKGGGVPLIADIAAFLHSDDLIDCIASYVYTIQRTRIERYFWEDTTYYSPNRLYVNFAEHYSWTPDVVDNLPFDLIQSFVSEWERQAREMRR